jgi:hypothetical protein
MSDYAIEVSEEQASILRDALDLYSRVLMLQLDAVATTIQWSKTKVPTSDLINYLNSIRDVNKQTTMGEWGSWGIMSTEVDDKARIACDIMQVVRYKLAWDRAGKDPLVDKRPSILVNFDEPYQMSKKEPLAKITKI